MNILEDIQHCAEYIVQGKTVLYPTDTVWGLGCDATNYEAIEKIYNIKNRPKNKSCIILVPTIKNLLKLIAAPPIEIEDIIQQFCDRPTTFIFEQAINLPDNLINEDGSIAIRIPKDDFCIQLLKKINRPLISTSANISEHPTPNIFAEISQSIIERVDYVSNTRREDTIVKAPSRIVKIYNDTNLKIIRE